MQRQRQLQHMRPGARPRQVFPSPRLVEWLRLANVVNQASEEDAPLITDAEMDGYYAQYKKVFGDYPSEAEELSKEQVSALKHLLDQGENPYVDFSVWGPNHIRLAKRNRLKGATLGAEGKLVPIELKGPADFSTWGKHLETLPRGPHHDAGG